MSLIYINPYSFPSTATDPDFASVSLLLHGDGANGSTTIIDSGPSPKTVTAVNNAQISTTIADSFGNSTRGVLAFDGTGDRLTVPNSSDFDASLGDFTIEFWMYPTQRKYSFVVTKQDVTGGSGYIGWSIRMIGGGLISVDNGTSRLDGVSAIPLNQWTFVSVTKAISTTRIFVNGVIDATGGNFFTANFNTDLQIGGTFHNSAECLNGYIDDLRITKTARYTANFTPPAAPFPDA